MGSLRSLRGDFYEADEKTGVVTFRPPADVMSRVPDNSETENHCRAAIREFLAKPAAKEKPWTPTPTPREGRPRLVIQIERDVLAKAREQANKQKTSLDAIFIDVCKRYAEKIKDDAGKVKLLLCKMPQVGPNTTNVVWKCPESIWNITGPDAQVATFFISEAIDRSLNEAWR